MWDAIRGKKTYALGAVLLAYLVIQAATGMEVNDNIVYGLMGAMGLTIRMGVAGTVEE